MNSPVLVVWARLLGLQGVGFVVAAASVAFAAAVMAPEEYGRYGLMLSAVQVGFAVLAAWLGHALVRFAREEYRLEGRIGATLAVFLTMQTAIVALVALVVALAGPLLTRLVSAGPGDRPLLVLAFVALVAVEGANYAAQATGRFRGYGSGPILAKLVPAAAIAAMAAGKLPATAGALLVGVALGWIAAAAWTGASVPRSALAGLKPTATGVRRMLGYGWVVPAGTTAGMLVTWMDVWFVRYHVGLDAAGAYTWAYQLYALAVSAFIPLSAILTPRMIDLHVSGDTAAAADSLDRIAAIFALFAGLMPLGLVVLRVAGDALAPAGYAAAIGPLVLLAAALAYQFLSYGVNPLLVGEARLVRRSVLVVIAMAVVNALGDALLVPLAGAEGAALAKAITIGGGAIALFGLAQRTCAAAGPVTVTGLIVLGAVLFAFAVGAAWLPAPLLSALAIAALLFPLALRAGGMYGDVGRLGRHLGPLPPALRKPAAALLDWLGGPPRRLRPASRTE